MKFITSSWSPNMLAMPHWLFDCHKITEKEFVMWSMDAYSCINKKNLANILEVPYNPKPVQLRPGDVLLVAHLKGGRLPDHAESLDDDVILEYYCYRVFDPNTHVIIDKEEVLMEE